MLANSMDEVNSINEYFTVNKGATNDDSYITNCRNKNKIKKIMDEVIERRVRIRGEIKDHNKLG